MSRMTRKNDELRATMGQLSRRSYALKDTVIGMLFLVGAFVAAYVAWKAGALQ